jgi:hypothetical protein
METPIRFTILKPAFNSPCNGCGYCCSVQPCRLAEEFLNCTTGPCVALEKREGRAVCGLMRNPLAYIFQAAHPEQDVPVLDEAPDDEVTKKLSADIAEALGAGKGCDSDDDEDAFAWPNIQLPIRAVSNGRS